MAEVEQPIIIKKIYKVEGGHHGGAWKVAYADFVTAMMAFFLLLWLLSSTSEGKLEGIAEYFSPTIGLKDALGIGFKGGRTDVLEKGTKRENTSKPSIISGQPPQGIKIGEPKPKALIESPEGEQMLFDKTASAINQALADDGELRTLGENVMMEQKPEGLSVQLMDSDKEPMFYAGGARLTATGERMLAKITQVIANVPNHISITGHTDAAPFTRMRYYTNWELSSDRANSARRFMIESGLNPEQVGKIQGRAAKELLFLDSPTDPKNRRIEIILLKGDHMQIAPTDKPADGGLSIKAEEKEVLQFEKKLPKSIKPVQAEPNKNFAPITVVPAKIAPKDKMENKELLEIN
jgi:chemotaxis protein MotB